MSTFEPGQLDQIQREESEARQRLAEAREQQKMDEGEVAHHGLLEKLEEEWNRARERLEHALHGKQD